MKMSAQGPCLLSLPVELRRSIYVYHFSDAEVWMKILDKIRPASTANPPRSMALLQTCRQIQSEASPVFYGQTLFHVRRRNRYEDLYLYQDGRHPPPSCYVNVTGIRDVTLPIEVLHQVGYRFDRPGRWKIKRPFQWVQHLTVDIRNHSSFGACSIQLYPLQLDKIQMYDAKMIKVMGESPGYSFRLSVRNYVCCRGIGSWTELIMDDIAHASTWRCEGYPDGFHYQYLQQFLQTWGLPSDQIQSIFTRGGIKWHEYTRRQHADQFVTDEDYLHVEEVEQVWKAIEKLAIRVRTADKV